MITKRFSFCDVYNDVYKPSLPFVFAEYYAMMVTLCNLANQYMAVVTLGIFFGKSLYQELFLSLDVISLLFFVKCASRFVGMYRFWVTIVVATCITYTFFGYEVARRIMFAIVALFHVVFNYLGSTFVSILP